MQSKKRKIEAHTPMPVVEHGGYRIAWRNGKYVVKLLDVSQPALREIRSFVLHRLNRAIEAIADTADLPPALREHAEILPYPKWLRSWLKAPTMGIDLDQAYWRLLI